MNSELDRILSTNLFIPSDVNRILSVYQNDRSIDINIEEIITRSIILNPKDRQRLRDLFGYQTIPTYFLEKLYEKLKEKTEKDKKIKKYKDLVGVSYGYGYGYGNNCGFDNETTIISHIKKNSYFCKIIVRRLSEIESRGGIYSDALIFKALFPNPDDVVITHLCDPNLNNTPSTFNLYLEHIDNKLFHTAEINLFMINHEIYFERKLSLHKMSGYDYILCKSNDAVFQVNKYRNDNRLKYNIKKIGFTTIPHCRESEFQGTKYYQKVIHIAGKSWMKNTLLVLETYIKYQQLGQISIICRGLCDHQGIFNSDKNGDLIKYENDLWISMIKKVNMDPVLKQRIRIFKFAEGLLTADGIDLKLYKNRNVMEYIFETYGIHLCPSEAEGWGHYLHEAKHCGNIIITTDRSPMNEHIKDGVNGFIVKTFMGDDDKYGVYGRFGVQKAKFIPKDMADLILKVKSMPIADLKTIGNNSTISFKNNDKMFKKKFKEFIYSITPFKSKPFNELSILIKNNPINCAKYNFGYNVKQSITGGLGESHVDVIDIANSRFIIKKYLYKNISNFNNPEDGLNIEVNFYDHLFKDKFHEKSQHIIRSFNQHIECFNILTPSLKYYDKIKILQLQYAQYGNICHGSKTLITDSYDFMSILFQVFYVIAQLYITYNFFHNDLTPKNILLGNDENFSQYEKRYYQYTIEFSNKKLVFYVPIRKYIVKISDFDYSIYHNYKNENIERKPTKQKLLNAIEKIKNGRFKYNAVLFQYLILFDLAEDIDCDLNKFKGLLIDINDITKKGQITSPRKEKISITIGNPDMFSIENLFENKIFSQFKTKDPSGIVFKEYTFKVSDDKKD
jgi:glycosyltransferase involved in cell wall biosynthesis